MEKSQIHEYAPNSFTLKIKNDFTEQVVRLLRTYPPRIEPNKLVLEVENLLEECQRVEVSSLGPPDVSEVFDVLLHSSINAAIEEMRRRKDFDYICRALDLREKLTSWGSYIVTSYDEEFFPLD
ncbi:hypothetical protein [Nostoc sp. MG11]|uniref:hypothetical protein n=1 Tax=Nostoc sp. MG11 TaxID=2721166 RepID=UPI00186652DA|nr:hypothetical protein [Nostoc sp. MG11]